MTGKAPSNRSLLHYLYSKSEGSKVAAHLITYDLGKPGQDYDELFKAIEQLADGWWHCVESVWIINSDLNASEIRNALSSFVDSNDKLVVLTLQGNWATRNLSQRCNEWMRNHM